MKAGQPGGGRPGHQGSGGAALGSLVQEIMAVKGGSRKGYEELGPGARRRLSALIPVKRASPPSRTPSRAVATSERRMAPIILPPPGAAGRAELSPHRQRAAADSHILHRLVPFAGNQYPILCRRFPEGQRDRRGPVRLHPSCLRGRQAGSDLCQDRPGIFASRVVAGQDDAIAKPSATEPISGRLPASRSPPQPNTHHSRPWHRGRRALRACSRAWGVWA